MGLTRRFPVVARRAAVVAVLATTVACGGAALTVPTPTTVGPADVAPSSTIGAVAEPAPTTVAPVPVSTTVAPVPVSTTVAPVPVSTTTLAGGPIPAAAPGFCYDLAVISGEIVLEVESVVAADGVLDARSHHGLLLATRNLLAWTSNRVPPAMSSDLRLLTGVYADLGVQLDRLDPETVTMPRLQALVFTYVFDSAEVDGAELDLSARRLSAFVATSCGHGYPLMESLADLFADVRED
ncbi:MAG: hypothetical protein MK177_07955 [Acidimicrobiales bacterium]|jgi:hypothetical protein|nr:hypothetical protein [Acidimicrobiales bacterium]